MIFLILVLALILRLVNLNQSLWLDEAVQAITAQKSVSYIFQEIVGDFHPPLYHFLMHYWVRLFGISEIVLRMPSVIFGVGAVWVVYRLGKLGGLGRLGLLGAVFMATAPFHIYYSQEARMYSMTCFFASLSMFYFLEIFSKGILGRRLTSSKFKSLSRACRGMKSEKLQFKVQNFDYLWYFLATLCLIYTDYYGLLVVLAQSIFLLSRKRYKFLILNTFFLILFYLPWLPMFIVQMKTGMLATQSLPGWGRLVNVSFIKAIPLTLIKFSIGRITIFNKTLYAGVTLIVALIYGGLVFRAFKGWLKEKLKDDRGTTILLWFFVPLTVAWLASLFIPNFQPFRLLLVLPAFYILISTAILNIKSKDFQILVIVIVLTINLVSLGVYYFNPYFHREDWRGVSKFLMSQKGTAILPSETSNWPIRYYAPQGEINIVYGGMGVEKIGDLGNLRDLSNKILYIRYLVPLFDPNEKILAELDARGYTKASEISFNQIPIWEFEKK